MFLNKEKQEKWNIVLEPFSTVIPFSDTPPSSAPKQSPVSSAASPFSVLRKPGKKHALSDPKVMPERNK